MRISLLKVAEWGILIILFVTLPDGFYKHVAFFIGAAFLIAQEIKELCDRAKEREKLMAETYKQIAENAKKGH